MKKRLNELESQFKKPQDEADELINLGRLWQKAVAKKDWETALKASEKAQPYFEKHPEWKQKPPKPLWNKMLFIDWVCFTCFVHPNMQAEYKQAKKESVTPGASSLQKER
jgi:hypothetical protein